MKRLFMALALVGTSVHAAAPADLSQRIAQAVSAHRDPYICTGDSTDANSFTCGTPNIRIGRLVAALVETLDTSAALSNTAGLPVKWLAQDQAHREGVLVFNNGSTASIRTNIDSYGGLVQIGFNTADCTGSSSEVCARDIGQALESAGVEVRAECVHRGGKVSYEVTGSGGQSVLISWRPGSTVPRTYIALNNGMGLRDSMTNGEQCQ